MMARNEPGDLGFPSDRTPGGCGVQFCGQAGLRVIEGLALEAPVLAVLGGGALGLRPGLGAVVRDRLVADARARPGDWDVFLAARGGSWLLGDRPDRYGAG